MSRRRAEAQPGSPERPRAGLLLDDLAEQLNRFRLLPGGSEADAERVLAGLTPASAYRWRVTALTNGLEGPPSNEAEAVSRPAAACANPGSCPWGN